MSHSISLDQQQQHRKRLAQPNPNENFKNKRIALGDLTNVPIPYPVKVDQNSVKKIHLFFFFLKNLNSFFKLITIKIRIQIIRKNLQQFLFLL